MMTMQALEVSTLTPDLTGLGIVARPVPEPGDGQVLVRIEAAALGFPDLLMTRGGYQAKPPLPFVPGMEAAGTVVAVGAGADWREGARVIVGGLTGGCAQFGVHATDAIVPMPDALSFPEAAALRAAYLTAWVALVRCGAAQPGQWVLIHGAAGGVGLAAVDLARALGLRVIAVASSEEKRRRIADLYAPEHVLAGPVGFREAVLDITGGRGADLVYDPVGGDAFDESTRCIAFGGRLLVVGFASGRIPDIRANIPLIKGFSVVGVRAGEFGRRFPDLGQENVAAIVRLAGEGRIRPHVHAALALSRWREAFEAMETRTVIGRTVLLPHAD